MRRRRLGWGLLAALLAVAGIGADVGTASADEGKPDAGPSASPHRVGGGDEVATSGIGGVGDGGFDNGDCHGDLVSGGTDFDYQRLILSATTRNGGCSSDPSTWFPGISEVDWYLDFNGDDIDDYAVAFDAPNSGPYVAEAFRARPDGSFTPFGCLGTPTYAAGSGDTYTARVRSSCFPAGPFRFYVQFTYDENPSGSTCTCPTDFAPDLGYSGSVPRREHNRDGDGAGAASAGPGQLDVFVRGADGRPYTRHFESGSFGPFVALSGILRGTPAPVSPLPGEMRVFVRGQDDALHVAQRTNGTFGGFATMGGILTSSPAAVSAAPGEMDVFVAGSDRALYTNHFDGTSWSGFRSLGGIITATPAVTSPSPGTIVVFVRGVDNGLYELTLTSGGGNSGWSARGGIINAAPAATSQGDGSIDVFVRGQDLALYALHIVGAGSGGWQPLGGIISGPPGATSAAPGTLDVFIRGQDEALWWNHLGGGQWSGWISLGGNIT